MSEKTVHPGLREPGDYVEKAQQAFRPMTDQEKIEVLFKYHSPRPDQIPKYESIRTAAKYFAEVILQNTPPSRAQKNAINKLEIVVMLANKSIATDGLTF